MIQHTFKALVNDFICELVMPNIHLDYASATVKAWRFLRAAPTETYVVWIFSQICQSVFQCSHRKEPRSTSSSAKVKEIRIAGQKIKRLV